MACFKLFLLTSLSLSRSNPTPTRRHVNAKMGGINHVVAGADNSPIDSLSSWNNWELATMVLGAVAFFRFVFKRRGLH